MTNRPAPSPGTTETFHISDLGDVEAMITYDPDAPCHSCGTSARVTGWKLRTTGSGFDVFQCPTCKTHVAVAQGTNQ